MVFFDFLGDKYPQKSYNITPVKKQIPHLQWSKCPSLKASETFNSNSNLPSDLNKKQTSQKATKAKQESPNSTPNSTSAHPRYKASNLSQLIATVVLHDCHDWAKKNYPKKPQRLRWPLKHKDAWFLFCCWFCWFLLVFLFCCCFCCFVLVLLLVFLQICFLLKFGIGIVHGFGICSSFCTEKGSKTKGSSKNTSELELAQEMFRSKGQRDKSTIVTSS